jgi:hypothetical protein
VEDVGFMIVGFCEVVWVSVYRGSDQIVFYGLSKFLVHLTEFIVSKPL